MIDDSYWLDRVRGYIELHMYDEAWAEIERLPVEKRNLPETCEMRITVRLDQNRLKEALALAAMLSSLHPENHAGFIQGAYCLHALGRTQDAIAHLQSGPDTLREEPVYFYNLACYEQALGKSQAALTWLRTSIEMDPKFRSRAVHDPDLVAILSEI